MSFAVSRAFVAVVALTLAGGAAGKIHPLLHSEAGIDRILAADPTDYAEIEVHARGLGLPHFNIPLGIEFDEDAFENLNLISMSQKVEGEGDGVDKDSEAPILCETICRPMEKKEAGKMPKNPEGKNPAEGTPPPDAGLVPEEDGAPEEAGGEGPAPAPAEMMLLQMQANVGKQLCEAKAGAWDHASAECDPFMKNTKKKLTYDPKGIFNACQEEHGMLYVPCNPYQALALAHMYKVDDHSYYWLWPGGRHDQVHKAAFKQDVGNNPVKGLDTCPDEQHLGFFHNWDEAHVDSWGCLHESQNIPVLCCRRG